MMISWTLIWVSGPDRDQHLRLHLHHCLYLQFPRHRRWDCPGLLRGHVPAVGQINFRVLCRVLVTVLLERGYLSVVLTF